MATNPGPVHDEGPAPGLADVARAIGSGERRGKWKRGLLVSVFTLAGITLVLELGLRVTSYRQRHFEATVNKTNRRWVELTTAGFFEEISDPIRRYAMRPGASCTIDGWRFRASGHRTRGEDFPAEKPPDERRLLVLGDSYAFGLWCDDDETTIGHLARLANEHERELGSGIHWRAINCAVPGYHAGQQALTLEQDGLALDPDVVVWHFNTNDIEQEGFFFDPGLGVLRRDFLPLPTRLRRVLWNSYLYGWIVTKHRNLMESGPVAPHLNPDVPYAYVREDNKAATRRALERAARLCRERDIPLFVLNQPHLTWQGNIRNPEWPELPLVYWVEATCAQLGIPSVNLLGLYRGYSDGVDRLAEGAEPDWLLDVYVADPDFERAVEWAKNDTRERGLDWDGLTTTEQIHVLGQSPVPPPAVPDFHLTGEGYGHMARVAYDAMRARGVLP